MLDATSLDPISDPAGGDRLAVILDGYNIGNIYILDGSITCVPYTVQFLAKIWSNKWCCAQFRDDVGQDHIAFNVARDVTISLEVDTLLALETQFSMLDDHAPIVCFAFTPGGNQVALKSGGKLYLMDFPSLRPVVEGRLRCRDHSNSWLNCGEPSRAADP